MESEIQNICCPLGKIAVNLGRAMERLKIILEDDQPSLSKYDPYWTSEYELEDDKLHDIRLRMQTIQDNLWDVWAILRGDE